MISTSSGNKEKIRLWAICVWLFVWQIGSAYIGQEILLVSPVTVVLRLFELIREFDFWQSIAFSLLRIAGGFVLASAAGIFFAAISSRILLIRELLTPLVLTVKTIPVASFIILVLLWIPSRNLSVFISFLMVFPILYTSVLNGIENTSPELLEMAKVFCIPKWRVIRYIYLFQILPFFHTACQVALGLCWKAGTAAEIIGIPKGSIGEKLYQAKIYMNSPDLFAWTVAIILISLVFEKSFLFLLQRFALAAGKSKPEYRKFIPEIKPVKSNPEASSVIPVGHEYQSHADESLDNNADQIRCIHIFKSFGTKKIFCNFSADFPIGKTSILTGPSGQGKTTLLRLISGLETVDSGEIKGIKNKKISIVFQEDRLCDNLNPIQNIRLASHKKISAEEIRRTMESAGLINCENQPVRELSGGMRRRVALLRALYADFDILLLDEPFKGIDFPTVEKLVDLLLEKTRGKTIIFVSHEQLSNKLPVSSVICIP